MGIVPKQGEPLELYQGSTFDETWTFQDEDGVVISLTGWSAALKVRADYTTAPILALASAAFTPPAADGIVMGGAAGTIRIYVRDETTAALAAASFTTVTEDDGTVTYTGVWDLELTNPAGETFRYVMGTALFSREVTYG